MAVKFDFKTLGQRIEVEWPVTVHEPQDGGVTKEQTFNARFALLTDEQTTAAQTLAATDPAQPYAWVAAFFVGLGKDEELLTPEMKALMLNTAWIRVGIIRAYVSCAKGVAVKN